MKYTQEELQHIRQQIDTVDWSAYDTAYGNASGMEEKPLYCSKRLYAMLHRKQYQKEEARRKYLANVADRLRELFSEQEQTAIDAASDLWAALCHQRVFVSSAALPAYEILLYCLRTTDSLSLQEELMDIFLGFTQYTVKAQTGWAKTLREKLLRDKEFFHSFAASKNEYISEFSKEILESLQTT